MQSETIKRLLGPSVQFVKGESARGVALAAASLFAWAGSRWAPEYFTLGEMSPGIRSQNRRFEKPLLVAALGLAVRGCPTSPEPEAE